MPLRVRATEQREHAIVGFVSDPGFSPAAN
jgi:hypothetical protein